jgi:hypothetical protein
MSDNNKNFQNDLNDLFNEAKTGAKKAAEKAEEFAKQAANEFSEDADKVFSDGKNIAIIAHLTPIGWVIAVLMHQKHKTAIGSFYIRQVLGFMLLSLVSVIPVFGWILWLVVLAAWIMSLINALGGEMKVSFLLGKQFQDWFRSL